VSVPFTVVQLYLTTIIYISKRGKWHWYICGIYFYFINGRMSLIKPNVGADICHWHLSKTKFLKQ